MLKVFGFLTKLPHLSEEAFFAHWRDPHGVLTKRITPIERYSQNHKIGPVPGFALPPYTGIATIWLADLAAMAAMADHPDYPPLGADGDRMYQRSALAWLVGHPTVTRPVPETLRIVPAKSMLLLKRAGGGIITDGEMAALCVDIAGLIPDALGIAYASRVPDSGEAPCDAMVEIAFDDRDLFDRAWAARGGELIDAISHFADLRASRAMVVREERVI